MKSLLAILIVVMLALVITACSEKPMPEQVTIDGVTYRAETKIEKSSQTADVSPFHISPWITITNTNEQTVTVLIKGCPVSLRLYKEPSRSGKPVWDLKEYREGISGKNNCMQDPYEVSLRPHESHEDQESVHAQREILSDSISEGRYYFTVTFELSDQQLELAAGEAKLNYGLDGLVFTAKSEIVDLVPRRLQTTLTVTNTSDERVLIEYGGGCAFWVKMYDNPEHKGPPVWSEKDRPNPNPRTGVHWVCTDQGGAIELGSGESATPRGFTKQINEPEIMGYPFPGERTFNDGLYYFAISVDVNYTSVEVSEAGEAEMQHTKNEIPRELTLNGVNYKVETRLVQRDYAYVQAILKVSNMTSENRNVQLPVYCPVSIHSFLDERMRDNPYLENRNPDWEPRSKCEFPGMANVNLEPHESLEFIQEYLVRESLREERLGHHYFVANVWQGENFFPLRAGDLELHY